MFQEFPANKKSLARRKPLFGVGINDAEYIIYQTVDGKKVPCPFYTKWSSILERCYSVKFQGRGHSYVGCTIVKEWLTFSVFKSWMEKQDWKGKALDKDLLTQGNKVYGPETCIFVKSYINNLLISSNANRGKFPQGVSLNKANGKYQSNVHVNGKQKHIGSFGTPEDASEAYKAAKYAIINCRNNHN